MGLKENIKQERLKNNMTLEVVAKHIGVSKQTVQKYESGVVSNIPAEKVEALAQLFGTTPACLMGWEERSPFEFLEEETVTVLGVGGERRTISTPNDTERNVAELLGVRIVFDDEEAAKVRDMLKIMFPEKF